MHTYVTLATSPITPDLRIDTRLGSLRRADRSALCRGRAGGEGDPPRGRASRDRPRERREPAEPLLSNGSRWLACGLAAVGAPARGARETQPFSVALCAASGFEQRGATNNPPYRLHAGRRPGAPVARRAAFQR
jgi:hypothetical protein